MTDTPAAAGTAAAGITTVSREVVEKIAVTAARSVPGVADLGGDVARFVNAVLDKVGLDEAGDAGRGADAKVRGGNVTVDLVLVIEAGTVVAEVTRAVQAKVTEALQGYGLTVVAVNIKVDDIRMPREHRGL
jgi:uncharacterized alkaline shock family protein YloU